MMKFVLTALFVVGFVVALAPQSAEAARRCKSQAYEKKDAVEFCAGKLKCGDKTPPQVMKCTGKPRRWICRCIAPKPAPTGGNSTTGTSDVEIELQEYGLPSATPAPQGDGTSGRRTRPTGQTIWGTPPQQPPLSALPGAQPAAPAAAPPKAPVFSPYEPVSLPSHFCSIAEKGKKFVETMKTARKMGANAAAANQWYDEIAYGEGAETADGGSQEGTAKDAIREWENAEQLAKAEMNAAKAIEVKECDENGVPLPQSVLPELGGVLMPNTFENSPSPEPEPEPGATDPVPDIDGDPDRPIILGPYEPKMDGGSVRLDPLTPEQQEMLDAPIEEPIESVIPELGASR
jgi:hypothetical protein